jgi:cell shape-determining protein MreC
MEGVSAQREIKLRQGENEPEAEMVLHCRPRLNRRDSVIDCQLPPPSVITPRTLIGLSVLLLMLSAVLGLLNTGTTRDLRVQVSQADSMREAADRLLNTREKELKERQAAVAATNAQFDESQTRIAVGEAELTKAQKEKEDLQGRVRENETEIAQLRKRIDEAEEKPAIPANAPLASTVDLQAQLEDAKKQLAAAERGKASLSDKGRVSQERPDQLKAEKKKRIPARDPGIHGTVLAVNRAYNFVVLNLGERQGVEANTEMLVLRGGSFIGKIRISSVEPATSIGDIITSSLARGVQVQTGDTVIYAGPNS